MDKLQPLLKNHFWILLVPLFSMNLWGYFSANGALKEATPARVSALDTVKSKIPVGSAAPNEVYTTELKKRNELLDKYVNEELVDLWAKQQARMIWPQRVAADIPKVYLADIKNTKVRYTYQKDYPDVVRQLHESVEPFVADKRGIPWTPKVDFPIQLIPQMRIGTLSITSKQMWDAQEDIWVTQFILDAIRKMNKDADSETSAVIRRVIAYRLLGGDGAAGGAAATGAPGSEIGGMPANYEGAGNASMGGQVGNRITSSVRFDPAEEFGAGGEPAAGVNAGTMATMMQQSSSPSGEGGADATAATGPLRYYKDDPTLPYVERGFYLSVIINQKNLVDFLVALSNSDWSVRVVRFHFGKNPYATDPFTAVRGGAGNASPFGMGGRPTGGYTADPAGSGQSSFPGLETDMNSGEMAGNPMGMAGTTGYPVDALQHPDLVQLDLAGLITLYRQPPAVIAALETAATGIPPAADATSGEVPAEAESTTPTTPAVPATGDPPAAAPAVVPETPGTPVPEAGTPVPPEGTPAPTPEGTPPATPVPAPAVPAPAAESPPAAEATTPAETPATP